VIYGRILHDKISRPLASVINYNIALNCYILFCCAYVDLKNSLQIFVFIYVWQFLFPGIESLFFLLIMSDHSTGSLFPIDIKEDKEGSQQI
jgi:hypothetical protein